MLNEPLRFSRFAHLLEKDGVGAFWHSLKLELVFVKEPLMTLIQEFRYGATADKILSQVRERDKKRDLEQLIPTLTQVEILVPIHHDEMAVLKETQEFNLRVSIGILYLLLTDACNFRCKYCFIENALPSSHKFSMMTQETAKAALDFFVKCLKKNPQKDQSKEKTIIFYGGEPLTNREVFRFALEYIRTLQEEEKLPRALKIALITNGSLIDEEISELIAKHEVRPSISIDGPPEIHDQLRKNIQGEGTFHQALRGYKMLQQKKVPVSISCTIGPHNLDSLERVFRWFVEHLGVQSMGFNLLLEAPGVKADLEYAKKANNKLIQCYKMARKYGIYEDRIMRKVRSFVEKRPHFIDCGGCGRQLVVSPDGKVGPCQAYLSTKKYFVGDLGGKFNPFQDSTFIEWSKRSPLSMPQCLDCEALGICGGGCAYNAEMRDGSMWAADKLFCVHSKETLRWLIWDLYKNTVNRRKEV
jgi:uncharacterized protein